MQRTRLQVLVFAAIVLTGRHASAQPDGGRAPNPTPPAPGEPAPPTPSDPTQPPTTASGSGTAGLTADGQKPMPVVIVGPTSSEPLIKSFPLMRKGILIGTGLAVHTFVPWTEAKTEMREFATAPVAYVGLLAVVAAPLFGVNLADETRMACTSYEGQKAADQLAIRRAYPEMNDQDREKVRASPSAENIAAVRAAANGWTIGRRASCRLFKYGLYLAKPAKFTTDVRVSDGTTASRDVRPLATAGFLYAPKPWVHFMFGVTWSEVSPSTTVKAEEIVTFSFGIGTSIDAIGGLVK